MIQYIIDKFSAKVLFLAYILVDLVLLYLVIKFLKEDLKKAWNWLLRYKFIVVQFVLVTGLSFYILNLIGNMLNMNGLKYISFVIGGGIVYFYNK